MSFLVVREHVHTDKQKLLKVLSRPMQDRDSAEHWRDFVKQEEEQSRAIKRKGYKYMVVEVLE